MLCNLKAELVRKNLVPDKAIEAVLGCSNRTAKSKLNGITDFTVSEAFDIVHCYFPNREFEYEFLFAKSAPEKEGA
ncbi:MAG: hypothetical protein IJX77_10165 [Ruminococcus sp.]|nr:hypothetical protein [Ruminococcus sp.]